MKRARSAGACSYFSYFFFFFSHHSIANQDFGCLLWGCEVIGRLLPCTRCLIDCSGRIGLTWADVCGEREIGLEVGNVVVIPYLFFFLCLFFPIAQEWTFPQCTESRHLG
jgi:hypothetical protein